jgi:hypothetical protein
MCGCHCRTPLLLSHMPDQRKISGIWLPPGNAFALCSVGPERGQEEASTGGDETGSHTDEAPSSVKAVVVTPTTSGVQNQRAKLYPPPPPQRKGRLLGNVSERPAGPTPPTWIHLYPRSASSFLRSVSVACSSTTSYAALRREDGVEDYGSGERPGPHTWMVIAHRQHRLCDAVLSQWSLTCSAPHPLAPSAPSPSLAPHRAARQSTAGRSGYCSANRDARLKALSVSLCGSMRPSSGTAKRVRRRRVIGSGDRDSK